MSKENLSQYSGIYGILNIVDWKVYVGQAKKFNKRDHIAELEKNQDNNASLQADYNHNKELVYMILYCSPEKIPKDMLNGQEKFYMTFMEEEFGFTLYNEQCNNTEKARANRKAVAANPEKLYIPPEEAKRVFIEDFKCRFGVEPSKLSNADVEERKKALEVYAKRRLTCKGREKFNGDRFLFNRQRIQTIFHKTIQKNVPLDIDEVFVSGAGGYLGEGIDQILGYEQDSIKKHKYCLWTFGVSAVAYETVVECCKKRQQAHKDTYVLFEYTFSNAYADAAPQTFSLLKNECVKKLSDDEKNFLSFDLGSYEHYYVPWDIDCTATPLKSAKAFVIQELYLLDDLCDMDKIKAEYKAVCHENRLTDIASDSQWRSTHFVRTDNPDIKLSDILGESSGRKFWFLGKLAAPYILLLKPEA